MTDINDSIYEDIKQYYKMEGQSEDLTILEEALIKVEELEVLLVENPYQSMMHRYLTFVKNELRRQVALQTTEELAVLKDALQQDL